MMHPVIEALHDTYFRFLYQGLAPPLEIRLTREQGEELAEAVRLLMLRPTRVAPRPPIKMFGVTITWETA